MPSGIHPSIFYSGNTLSQLGRHAQEAGQHQPECSARSAKADDNSHTADIADTHGSGYRSGQRLEVADLAFVVGVSIISAQQSQRMREPADIDKAEIKREKSGGNNEPGDDERQLGTADVYAIKNECRKSGRYRFDDRIDRRVNPGAVFHYHAPF